MKILVCFKVTPDFEALRAADWATAAEGRVNTTYVRRMLNCFDEAALEMALRLSEALAGGEGAAELGALTVGGRETEPYLKTLSALGYERLARVHADVSLDFAPAVTAALIAAYAQTVDHSDLLLLGERCGPGDSGTVPFLVAEALGWPCLTAVTELEPLAGGRVKVACPVDGALLRLTARPPCVLAVGNAVVSHLRVPTLTARLARRDTRIATMAAEELGVDVVAEMAHETGGVLKGLAAVDRGRRGMIVAGETPREKARALFDVHLKGLIEGLVEEVTERP